MRSRFCSRSILSCWVGNQMVLSNAMDLLYSPGYRKGCNNLVAHLDGFNFTAYLCDHTCELMSHDKSCMPLLEHPTKPPTRQLTCRAGLVTAKHMELPISQSIPYHIPPLPNSTYDPQSAVYETATTISVGAWTSGIGLSCNETLCGPSNTTAFIVFGDIVAQF
jgi:hypothetical protein